MADETKPVPVPASALIPVGGNNFASMSSIHQLHSLEASAPPFHQAVTKALIASGKVRDETIQPEQLNMVQVQAQTRLNTFSLGAKVKTHDGRKGIIIKASAGFTKKTKTPVHKLADREGRIWLEKETKLKLIL